MKAMGHVEPQRHSGGSLLAVLWVVLCALMLASKALAQSASGLPTIPAAAATAAAAAAIKLPVPLSLPAHWGVQLHMPAGWHAIQRDDPLEYHAAALCYLSIDGPDKVMALLQLAPGYDTEQDLLATANGLASDIAEQPAQFKQLASGPVQVQPGRKAVEYLTYLAPTAAAPAGTLALQLSVLTGHGAIVTLFVRGSAAQAAQLRATAWALVRGMAFSARKVAAAGFNAMSGHWWRQESSSSGDAGLGPVASFSAQWNLYFCSDGSFKRTQSSVTSGGVPSADGSGTEDVSALGSGSSQDSGKWSAEGSRDYGLILLRLSSGDVERSSYERASNSGGTQLIDGDKYFWVSKC